MHESAPDVMQAVGTWVEKHPLEVGVVGMLVFATVTGKILKRMRLRYEANDALRNIKK